MKKICINLFLGIFVLSLVVAAGSPELRQVLLNKAAIGYYQWWTPVVDAVNAPALINFNQRGTVNRIFDDWNRVKLIIQNETVEAPTEFNISRPDEFFYQVHADDDSGRMPVFLKPVEMRIMVPFPENLFDYGMYRLSANRRDWVRVSNVSFYSYTSEVVFNIYEPGIYRLMNPNPKTKEKKHPPYPNGTLLRGSDYKVYVVFDDNLYHVRTLFELSLRFPRQPIINVPMNIIEAYR